MGNYGITEGKDEPFFFALFSSQVQINETSNRITVQDCAYFASDNWFLGAKLFD